MKFLGSLLAFWALFAVACTPVNEEASVFRLGFIPSEKADELSPKAERLAGFLEEEMDVEVEIVIPTEYEPLIEGLRFGQLDAAYMDSGPAWLVTQGSDARVVLAELKDGEPHYFAEVFARSDDERINSLEDALGKKISFTSWTGSSGFIFPIGTLVDRGLITPESDGFAALEKAIAESFESYIVAGGYEQSLTMLLESKSDVAAGAHDAVQAYLAEEDWDKIKSVERLGKVPSHPVVVSANISSELEESFVDAMMKLNEAENVVIIEELYGVDGLIKTTTDEHLGDFGPVFEALQGVHEKVLNKHKSS